MYGVLHPFSFDDVLADSRLTDDTSLSYANVISELANITDSLLAFTNPQHCLPPMHVRLLSFVHCLLLMFFSCFYLHFSSTSK